MPFIMCALCCCSQRTRVLYPGLSPLGTESQSHCFLLGWLSHSSCLSLKKKKCTLVPSLLMVSNISGHLRHLKPQNIWLPSLWYGNRPASNPSIWPCLSLQARVFYCATKRQCSCKEGFVLQLKCTTKEKKKTRFLYTFWVSKCVLKIAFQIPAR